jgi:hypothetical protein
MDTYAFLSNDDDDDDDDYGVKYSIKRIDRNRHRLLASN